MGIWDESLPDTDESAHQPDRVEMVIDHVWPIVFGDEPFGDSRHNGPPHRFGVTSNGGQEIALHCRLLDDEKLVEAGLRLTGKGGPNAKGIVFPAAVHVRQDLIDHDDGAASGPDGGLGVALLVPLQEIATGGEIFGMPAGVALVFGAGFVPSPFHEQLVQGGQTLELVGRKGDLGGIQAILAEIKALGRLFEEESAGFGDVLFEVLVGVLGHIEVGGVEMVYIVGGQKGEVVQARWLDGGASSDNASPLEARGSQWRDKKVLFRTGSRLLCKAL